MTKITDIFLNLLLALCFCMLLIIIAIKTTVLFRPIYYLDIRLYNLESISGLSTDKIKETYNYILRFLTDKRMHSFTLPNFKASYNGIIHFYEVKRLFEYIDFTFYASLTVCLIILLAFKNINLTFFKTSAVILLSLIFNLLLKFGGNFDKSFDEFHEIFFNNNYWLFDPNSDPVINILPQEFFFHCAAFILSILLMISLLLIIIYKKKAVKPL